MNINKDEWYSGTQAQKLIGIKSRQYIPKYIKEGSLNAIPVSNGKMIEGKSQKQKNSGLRYAIKGEWILSFIERYKKGLVKGQKYTKAELKNTLNGALAYCFENKIETVKELEESVKKIKE